MKFEKLLVVDRGEHKQNKDFFVKPDSKCVMGVQAIKSCFFHNVLKGFPSGIYQLMQKKSRHILCQTEKWDTFTPCTNNLTWYEIGLSLMNLIGDLFCADIVVRIKL